MKMRKLRIAMGVVIIFIMMGFTACKKVTPISLKQEEIHSLSINVSLASPEKSISGIAEISNDNGISEAVQVINSLKVSTGENLDKELGGDSPSAWIDIFNEKGDKIDSIDFYYHIMRYDGEYYKMSLSQYDKLGKLCSKYGKCQFEP